MGAEHQGVAVVELDAPVVAVLAGIRPPSLNDSFGDYRPPGEQRIGIGDSVQITVWEAGPGGLFSSPVVDRESAGSRSAVIPEQTVARDGAITVPFAGRVQVAGRTPPEVERAIVARLTDKAIDPQALVSVTRNVSNVVTLVGDGGPGARVPLSVRGDRLLDVVASAGGLHSAVQDIVVVLARDGRTQRVPLQVVLDKPEEDVFFPAGRCGDAGARPADLHRDGGHRTQWRGALRDNRADAGGGARARRRIARRSGRSRRAVRGALRAADGAGNHGGGWCHFRHERHVHGGGSPGLSDAATGRWPAIDRRPVPPGHGFPARAHGRTLARPFG